MKVIRLKGSKIETRIRHVLDIMFYVVFTLLLIYAVFSLVAKINGIDVTFFGYRPVIVVSGSMEPAIDTNSLVIIKTCNVEDIELGDIVVYSSESRGVQVIHRVIEKLSAEGGDTFRTKGDANKAADTEIVNKSNIVGKVVTICNWVSPILDRIVVGGRVDSTRLVLLGASIFLVTWAVYLIVIVIKSELMSCISNYKKSIDQENTSQDDTTNEEEK